MPALRIDYDIELSRAHKMSTKGINIVKRCAFILLILAILAGLKIIGTNDSEKVHCVTGINNLNHYYILEFEKMNREDSYIIPACKDDIFTVNFRIDKGHADFIIAMNGRTQIYKGNDIDSGVFDVVVPEDGEYRITINAKHASGYVEVYANMKKIRIETISNNIRNKEELHE